jgi:hypothetical protein
MKDDIFTFWAEHNTRLNRIIGKNLVSTREEIAKELTEFAFWVDEKLEEIT